MNKIVRRKLYRIALYTAPLFGIYSVAHPYIFFRSFGFNPLLSRIPFEIENEYLALILPATFVAVVSFGLWVMNIELFRFQQQGVLKITDHIRYGLSFFLVLLLITAITSITRQFKETEEEFLRVIPYIASIANNFLILILISLTKSQDKRSQLELEKAQLELTALMAKQEQLRHQIHPHILFNTLSTLNVLIKNDTKQAEKFLLKLSSFLRKSLDSEGKHISPVSEEIAISQDYLDLQKLRFKDSIRSNVKLSPEHLTQGKLPLFSLQILIENAVKHNVSSQQKVLEIDVKSIGDKIVVSNNLLESGPKINSNGVGLKNLAERYRLFDAPEPKISKDSDKEVFSVELSVLS